MDNITERLVAARKRVGLTQKEVAQRMGITQPTLCGLERGKRGDPRFSTVVRYVQALGYELQLNMIDREEDW